MSHNHPSSKENRGKVSDQSDMAFQLKILSNCLVKIRFQFFLKNVFLVLSAIYLSIYMLADFNQIWRDEVCVRVS